MSVFERDKIGKYLIFELTEKLRFVKISIIEYIEMYYRNIILNK